MKGQSVASMFVGQLGLNTARQLFRLQLGSSHVCRQRGSYAQEGWMLCVRGGGGGVRGRVGWAMSFSISGRILISLVPVVTGQVSQRDSCV